MKANELMVGDYVYNHRNWECSIVEIHKNSAVVIARHYGEEEFFLSELRPIPLTPEILEKNGFLQNGESWWYHDFRIVLSSSKGVSLICGVQKRFEFVHQLQHALRLCGIEKELIL